MSKSEKSVTSVTSVTVGEESVTQLSLGVTDVTDVTVRGPREPYARARGVTSTRTRMEEKPASPSHPSQSVTPVQACDRCVVDETSAPCGRCPLYGAWLERGGLSADGRWHGVYAGWAAAGGWTALWASGRARKRAIWAAAVQDVLARFPRVRERWPNYPSAGGAR